MLQVLHHTPDRTGALNTVGVYCRFWSEVFVILYQVIISYCKLPYSAKALQQISLTNGIFPTNLSLSISPMRHR